MTRHWTTGSRMRRRVDPGTVALARAARNAARVEEAVAEIPTAELTHAAVAALSGVPEGYLRWRYPYVRDLVVAATCRTRADGSPSDR
jgi:hypothetical protein